MIKAANGAVSATAATGDIYIQSAGPLVVNQAIASAAGKQISLATTGTLAPLTVTVSDMGDDRWHLAATGNIGLTVTGLGAGINFNQILDLQAAGAGRSVTLHAVAGPITVSTVNAGVVTADDIVTLKADGGDVQSSAGAVLRAANLTLQASGAVGSALTPFEFAAPRLTTLSVGSQWLAASAPTRANSLRDHRAGQQHHAGPRECSCSVRPWRGASP